MTLSNYQKMQRHINLYFSEYQPNNYQKYWKENKSKYKDIVLSHYKGQSFRTIAKRHQITRQRAMQIEHRLVQQIYNWYVELDGGEVNLIK